jgi:hypothetical protein
MRTDRDASLRRMERLSRMRDFDVAPRRPITHETTVREEAVVNRADAEPPYRQR